MPQHKAVSGAVSGVAQPHSTLSAVPGAVDTLLGTGAASTPPSLVLCSLSTVVLGDCDWKVMKRERTYDTSTTTSSATAAVVPYQLPCQLQSKLFDICSRCVNTEVLLQYICVSYGYIEEEVEYIFIKLPALGSAAVIAPHLVTSVNTSHVVVISNDGLWTWHWNVSPISLASSD